MTIRMKEYFSHYLRESRASDCFRPTCGFDDDAFSSPSTNERDFRGTLGVTRAPNATQLDKHRFAENQCHVGSARRGLDFSLQTVAILTFYRFRLLFVHCWANGICCIFAGPHHHALNTWATLSIKLSLVWASQGVWRKGGTASRHYKHQIHR